jgi:hypothetical protein
MARAMFNALRTCGGKGERRRTVGRGGGRWRGGRDGGRLRGGSCASECVVAQCAVVGCVVRILVPFLAFLTQSRSSG